MAVLPHDDFHTLAVACVRAFTPKHPDNAHKAIEFDLDIDGEPFTLRAWAPSNYRQVWGRLPERLREKRPGRRSFGEWALLADHDSGWTSAFNVFDCARPPEYGVELARVRTGDLPVTADGGFVRVDEQSGQHLAPLSGRMWNLEGMDRWDAFAVLLSAFRGRADIVRAVFSRRDKPLYRMIEIADPASAKLVPRKNERLKEKEGALTGEGIRALLGRRVTDWRLWSVDFQKEGTHFF